MNEDLKDVVRDLQFLLRTYDGAKQLLVKSKQRLKSLNPKAAERHQKHIKTQESEKDLLSREIEKVLEFWDVWAAWMKYVPGIGPFIAGNLIILFFYRFVPICQKCGADLIKKDRTDDEPGGFICSGCGKSAKGDGVLKSRIEEKDFPNVSKWHAYLGEDNDEITGRMRRRKRGEVSGWSNLGRQISWSVGEAFNRFPHCKHCGGKAPDHKQKEERCTCENYTPKHDYMAFYWTHKKVGKYHSDAIRRTRKLFLSHFWHVARELEGKSTDGPYAEVILKHTGIIAPYYWEAKQEEKKAA